MAEPLVMSEISPRRCTGFSRRSEAGVEEVEDAAKRLETSLQTRGEGQRYFSVCFVGAGVLDFEYEYKRGVRDRVAAGVPGQERLGGAPVMCGLHIMRRWYPTVVFTKAFGIQ